MSARPKKRTAARRLQAGGAALAGLLPRAIALSLVVFGGLSILLASYQLTVLTARTVWTAAALVALAVIVFSGRRWGILLLVCLFAAGVWTWRNAETLLQGALLLTEQALTPLSLRLPDGLQALIARHDAQETLQLTTTALQALLVPSVLLTGYFVIRRFSVLGPALAILPLLPILFHSLPVAVAPFFCLVAAFLML